MAQYEISVTPSIEASDAFYSLSSDFGELQEQLDNILSELPENHYASQKQIAVIRGAVEGLGSYSKRLGRALLEITEVYSQAERSALGSYNSLEKLSPPPDASKPTIVHNTQSVFLFGNLLLPDWLQSAVLKYEQSQGAI